jgi:EAL domain-containing protein (putative c-di-GMP-specific phosphodiesterase class I)
MPDRPSLDTDLTRLGTRVGTGAESGTEHDLRVQAGRFGPLDASEARALKARAARRDVTERRRVTARLREALASNGLLLHFQPQLQLKTGEVRGAEALIRLQHKRRGLILPNHFMPIAERTDIINDIGAWMLNHACAVAAEWPERMVVALSLSHRQLRSGKLTKHLIEALSRSGLAPYRLEVELTEAMLIDDNDDTLFSLRALQGLGVRLALDNFGCGYASLSALKRLPLSTLKLDRSLVEYLGQDLSGTAIVHAAVEAGHALGCSVLAEGVETAEQCRLLDEIGCDEAQGPYFCPPVTLADFRAKFT